MAPPFFKDFSKPMSDILSDDYTQKKTLKIKHTTPVGVGWTIENEHKKGTLAGKISVKYAHSPSGFSLDKVTLKPDGGQEVECSLSNVAPGLKFKAKLDDEFKGNIGSEYTTRSLALKADLDVELTNVDASGTINIEGVNLGGGVSAKLPGDKPASVTGYGAGISYGAKGWLGAFTASKNQPYGLSASYACTPAVTTAMVANLNPDKGTQSVTVGFKWQLKPATLLRAKATSDGVVSAAFSHACAPAMNVAVATEANLKDLQPKFGLTCTLG